MTQPKEINRLHKPEWEKRTKKSCEADIQRKFVALVESVGGLAIRQKASDYPDYLCVSPKGRIYWVEFKRSKTTENLAGTLSVGQNLCFTHLKTLGQKIYIFVGEEHFGDFMYIFKNT